MGSYLKCTGQEKHFQEGAIQTEIQRAETQQKPVRCGPRNSQKMRAMRTQEEGVEGPGRQSWGCK